MKFSLYTDGGSRGNPGPGGAGAVLLDESNEIVLEDSKYLGKCTNNEAEYRALLLGLALAKSLNVTKLTCYLDSELVVKQLNGEYKVKNPGMRFLYTQAKQLEGDFPGISYVHVKRDKNKRADFLVNEVLDNNASKTV